MDETKADAAQAEERPAAREPETTEGHALAWQWFNTHIANSPAAQFTPGLNHLSAVALPALIAKIDALLGKKG